MTDIRDLGINANLGVEIKDFMNDPQFYPKNQQKFFFDDSMSYYQQLCKITKLLTEFQNAFAIVYENEEALAESQLTQEDIDNAVNELRTAIEEQLEVITDDIDNIQEDVGNINELLADHTEAIGTLSDAVDVLEEQMRVANIQIADRLKDVRIYGQGFVPGASTIVDGIKYLELNVESTAGGTVTSITAGNGLTGGTITGAGTIAIDDEVVALKTDLPNLSNYVLKSEANGYNDILTTASAQQIYQTMANMSNYVAKTEATGYGDILTKTEAQGIYTPLTNDVVSNDTLNSIADMNAPKIMAQDSNNAVLSLTTVSNNPTIRERYSLYGATGETTNQTADVTFDGTQFEVSSAKIKVKDIFAPLSQTYSNIQVTVTPTAQSVYQPWDTEQKYGYMSTLSVSGITTNSLIKNIVMSDTLLNASAPYIETETNSLVMYFESGDTISGTIYLIVTEEVL